MNTGLNTPLSSTPSAVMNTDAGVLHHALPQAPQPQAALPRLRQDLELLPGPVLDNIGRTWRIRDPARNRFFDIGPFEFAALSSWSDTWTLADLAAYLAESLDTEVEPEQLLPLIAFLQENELLVPERGIRDFLRQKRRKNTTGIWGKLLHNYLFFRVPLLNPEPLLDWIVGRTEWIFSRKVLWLMLALAVVDIHLIFQHWGELVAHFDYSFSWDGLLLVGAAGIFSKIFHEFGHAITARRYGVRVPAIGVAFVVMYPMLYTDTSDSWRLQDKHQRLTIAAAGMISEFSLALCATLLWAITPDGIVRSALFSLAFVGWLIALGLNASPFFRFDGYYILSDAVDIQNLHERGGALARQRFRAYFLGIDDPDPEPYLDDSSKRWLTAFSTFTWCYRLIVFVTIAVLVYQYFFKVLGIVLMLVELVWFVCLPLYREGAALKKRLADIRPQWHALAALAVISLSLGWLWTIATTIKSPAVLSAKNDYLIQTPGTGLLVQVSVENGQRCKKGEELAIVISPEALLKRDTANISRNALVEELQRTVANASSRERIGAIQNQISQLSATEKLSVSESRLLRLRAQDDGVVRDLLPEARPGRWVRSREILMHLVSEHEGQVTAYVSEATIHRVRQGARAIFYPENPELAPVSATVVEVDTATSRSLPIPMLASAYGGPLPATKIDSGDLIMHESRYRIRLQPDQAFQVTQIQRGTVSIEGDGLDALMQLPTRMMSTLIREVGF